MRAVIPVVIAGFAAGVLAPPTPSAAVSQVPLSPDRLELYGVKASAGSHEGRPAIRLIESNAERQGGLALLEGFDADDMDLRIEVAGRRGPYAQADDRGFVGIAFRAAAGAARYEYIYLRPDNGRADDQERRNHATQYASHPDFPWQLLRKTVPGRYESYVDLMSGAWTPMRVVVRGRTARLYVHRAAQPSLVVNDLKLPAGRGQLGLWIGAGTEAFFDKLSVQHLAAQR